MEIRDASGADIGRGLLETLANLSPPPDEEVAREALREIMKTTNIRMFVVEEEGQVVAAVTLLLERKLIHRGGKVGHIEDVATRKGYEGRGYARALIEHAVEVARRDGCYKAILNCGEDLVLFYTGLKFSRSGVQMRNYLI